MTEAEREICKIFLEDLADLNKSHSCNEYKMLMRMLDAESCEDTISRQAAIDALDVLCQEHRYKIPGKGETYSEYNEAWQDALDRAEGIIFNLPSAQPEPCNDAISRQATLNCFHSWVDKHGDVHEADEMEEYKAIEALPSAQPERKTGHWIDVGAGMSMFPNKCSECGNREPSRTLYCPKCGAKMENNNDG